MTLNRIASLLAENPQCEIGPEGIKVELLTGETTISCGIAVGPVQCECGCDRPLDDRPHQEDYYVRILTQNKLTIDLRDSSEPEVRDLEILCVRDECALAWRVEIEAMENSAIEKGQS